MKPAPGKRDSILAPTRWEYTANNASDGTVSQSPLTGRDSEEGQAAPRPHHCCPILPALVSLCPLEGPRAAATVLPHFLL